MFSRKFFLLGVIFGLIALAVFLFTKPDGKLHIVFCDVGQGDAAYIRTPDGKDMLIDGGPDTSVLACLGRHMPFWDRHINIVVVTHPQKDHAGGIDDVVTRYKVDHLILGPEGTDILDYVALRQVMRMRNIPTTLLYAGDTFSLGPVRMDVLWPSRAWIEGLIDTGELTVASTSARLASGAILGYQTGRDLNDFSYYMKLIYGTFDVLFTGDGDARIQPEIINTAMLSPVEAVKFPHHGSKTGMLPEFLEKIQPDVAVISVGKNSYGHPTDDALRLLRSHGVQTRRTDLDGDVEIISDGINWRVASHKK